MDCRGGGESKHVLAQKVTGLSKYIETLVSGYQLNMFPKGEGVGGGELNAVT